MFVCRAMKLVPLLAVLAVFAAADEPEIDINHADVDR